MGQRILKITNRLLPYFFGVGERHYRVTKDALPEGVRIRHARMDIYTGMAMLILESSEWSDVPEGDQIPEVRPTMQSIPLPIHEASADD